jgi:hypothetical protein
VNIDKETKRKIIDLRIQHRKKIREIVSEVGKSSRDITTILREYEIQQGRTTMNDKGKDSSDHLLPNVKAYKLFDEGKSPLEVVAELNLPWPQVQQYYVEFLNMKRMYKLVTIYHENQDSMGYFLKLTRLGKEQGVTPEQIMNLVQMADSIHMLEDKLQRLQNEISDKLTKESEGQKELNDLCNEISNTKERLDVVKKTFNIKYEELKSVCSQAQKLQKYVERFKDGQDYGEVETIIRNEVEKTLSDNKRLLQNAFFSVLLALRNDPNRYSIVDMMELTPFTTTIINYDSYLASRRPSYSQQSEQLISGRVLEVAERIFCNLQKSIVDSTISTASGCEIS